MLKRIYHPTALKVEDRVTLTASAAAHCFKVLRLRADDALELFCNDGHLYTCTVIDSQRALVQVLQKVTHSVESPLSIHLGQGLARNDRMDWIFQKSVECGVNEITPLLTEKSIVKLKSDKKENKRQHWEQIIISACEQSGRTVLPALYEPMPLSQWVQVPFEGVSIVFEPGATLAVKELKIPTKKVRVLLGPESGLSDKEITLAKKAGFQACHLGPRILRTETATIAALTVLQNAFGDF